MEHFKEHRSYCRETCAIRKNAATDLFNEACKLQAKGNKAMEHMTNPDRKEGHAMWNGAIAKYQECLELEPTYEAARSALVGLLEWQEDAIRRHSDMCKELVYDFVDWASSFALEMCKAVVYELAETATCLNSDVVFTSWLFKEAPFKGIGGQASFQKLHAAIERKHLIFYKNEKHEKRKDVLDLTDVLSITTDFPFLEPFAFPPAYTRLELRTKSKAWLLAIPQEEIAKKREWMMHIAEVGGLDLVDGGRSAVKKGHKLEDMPRQEAPPKPRRAVEAIEDDAGE